MAKRRRRIKIKNSSLFAFIILKLLIASGASSQNHNYQTTTHLQHQHQHQHHYQQHHQSQDLRASSQQQHYVSPNVGGLISAAHLCTLIPVHVSRHLKLCKLISGSPNADEAVALGASKGLAECRDQFKTERWNCTHAHGDHHMLTSELAQSVGNKESGFVHAIAAAGIVHSIATACSVGNLTDCACDKSRIGSSYWHMDEKWKWGGCSNNIRHGMLFAKHLVELLDAIHQNYLSTLLHHRNQPPHQTYQNHEQHAGHSPSLHHHHHNIQHRLRRRSLSSIHREPNQLRGRQLAGSGEQQQLVSGQQQQQQQQTNTDQQFGFCQRNHNISQAAHLKLIKSLLSAHSLERHQEFRLAMNMHNNKVGRMAVAKNMEFRCRCHGLSGSCSLKTCWLSLPNFQVIGAYLKRKYDASVHLPTAVDVNKLIPMMNRDEISAILSSNDQLTSSTDPSSPAPAPNLPPASSMADQRAQTAGGQAEPMGLTSGPNSGGGPPALDGSVMQPEFAALVSLSGQDQQGNPAREPAQQAPSRPPLFGAHFIVNPLSSPVPLAGSQPPTLDDQHNLSAPINTPTSHYNYYERHKQLQSGAVELSAQQSQAHHHSQQHHNEDQNYPHHSTGNQSSSAMSTAAQAESSETSELVNLAPLTQQQYQALLKDMRLCNTTTTPTTGSSGNNAPQVAGSGISVLTTRDLQQQQQHQPLEGQQHPSAAAAAAAASSKRQILKRLPNYNQQANFNGQLVKSANQHLSQILQHSKKDDLIYLHKSPNYCEADVRHGFAGIQSRVCSDDPLASNNCDKLCCGRGYTTRIYQHSYKCECKFQYCCSILCNVCENETKLLVCK